MAQRRWELLNFEDNTARNEAIRDTKRLLAKGMSRNAIARQLGVSRGFVQYHALTPEQKREALDGRLKRWRDKSSLDRGIRVCPLCGDEKDVSAEYIKRIERGQRSELCASCARRRAMGKGPKPRPVDPSKAWMRPEERESHLAWAARVRALLSPRECRLVAEALDIDAIRDVDESRPARHARMSGTRGTWEMAA